MVDEERLNQYIITFFNVIAPLQFGTNKTVVWDGSRMVVGGTFISRGCGMLFVCSFYLLDVCMLSTYCFC